MSPKNFSLKGESRLDNSIPFRIKDYSHNEARKLTLRVALILSFFTLVIVSLFTYSHLRTTINSLIGSQVGNFSFWLQVNDQFQMQRTSSEILKNNSILGVRVDTLEGDSVFEVRSNKQSPANAFSKSFSFANMNLMIPIRYDLTNPSELDSQKKVGELIVLYRPPTLELLSILIILLLVIYLAHHTFNRAFRRFSNNITEPVYDLALQISAKTRDLSFGTNLRPKKFEELIQLAERFNEMTAKIRETESIAEESRRNSALYNLARQVTHDIRSPVMALKMIAQNSAELPEQQRELLNASVNRISKMADDLLKKHIANKPGESNQERTNLGESLRRIISEKKTLHNSKNLFLTCNFLGTSFYVKTDESKLERTLSNLIDNAIEAAPTEKSISIQVRENEESIQMDLIDNGPGLPEHLIHGIEKNPIPSTKKEGNGIGLSSSIDFILGSKGKIDFTNTNPGLKVSIQLPKSL
jgi:signal transduction histidine kinase